MSSLNTSTELPIALKAACISGNVAQAKSLAYDYVKEHLSEARAVLSQMAILSAKNSQPTILALCFSAGLRMDAENDHGPLVYAACRSCSIPVFEVLLANGMDANKHIMTIGCPLGIACCCGKLELVRFLLDSGADPNSGDIVVNYTGFIWALIGRNASLDVVALMLERGFKVKGTGAMIEAADYGNLEGLQLLVTHAEKTGDGDLEENENDLIPDPWFEDGQGTALYRAAATGRLAIVEFLLKKGANAKFKDRRGRSVLDIAVEKGHRDIARMIGQHDSQKKAGDKNLA